MKAYIYRQNFTEKQTVTEVSNILMYYNVIITQYMLIFMKYGEI